ncbi:MAG TPA: MarR family transcriptional regulator [Gammaproteobacteria bacterium]|nr:MarR family transcriptional regulator [Gammaproteobacteria bacterium]
MYNHVYFDYSMFERCLYFNLNALTRKVNRLWEAEFRPTGLSPSHAYLMRLILDEPGLSQKQLAEELRLDPSTVARFVDALAARRLVHRDTSSSDRRSATVIPTREGKRLQKTLEKIADELFHTLRKRIGDKAFRQLVNSLRETRNALDDDKGSPS